MKITVFKRVLDPLTKVRILVPQPHKIKGLRKTFVTPFVFNGILYLYSPTDIPNVQQKAAGSFFKLSSGVCRNFLPYRIAICAQPPGQFIRA